MDERISTNESTEELGREIDIYIRQNLRLGKIDFGRIVDGGLRHVKQQKEGGVRQALEFFLKKIELSFSEKLLKLIEKKGRKPSEVYIKAGLTRAHFSKIKADSNYHPTKETALAFAIALHLDLDETSDLIKRAGYSLSHSSESDLIVEFFIVREIYNIDEINTQLHMRGHKTLTNWRKKKEE